MGFLAVSLIVLAGQAWHAKAAPAPSAIFLRSKPAPRERLAASEVQRYVYVRTGTVLPIRNGTPRASSIVIGSIEPGLQPQQFTIRTVPTGRNRTWWIIGGDEAGTLYGAYRFAEHLGVGFSLEGDILPEERLSEWPEINETGKPRFALRGLQPFHDFSTGPDWWNAWDYESVLSQMAKLRLNFIGLHTYPSWNPAAGPEVNVWIGLPEDVDANGDVRFGYEAGVVTTRRGWAVTPFATSHYASGAGLLFAHDDYGPDFMLDCLDWPKEAAAATALFNRHGDFQNQIFSHAHKLGVKTCVGTELPLGVPPALAERLKSKGMDPRDPEVIRRLYEGTFLRLNRKLPIDYFWLWVSEVWLSMEPGSKDWEMTSKENVERNLAIAIDAAEKSRPPFGFATSGWRLGTREDPLWLHKRTPKTWAASSINNSLGRDPVEAAYGQMTDRPRWAIGWAEDDDTAGAHCCTTWDLQLWAARLISNSDEAHQFGCEGMMAIHWRTAAIAPNIMALSRAGWTFENPARVHPSSGAANARPSPGAEQNRTAVLLTALAAAGDGGSPADKGVLTPDTFWRDWGRTVFGKQGAEIGRIMQKLDGSHLRINALVAGGAGTTDAQIEEVFGPLRELEAQRGTLKGIGTLDRFDYWVDLIRASERRVRTWVLAARLGERIKQAPAMPDADAKTAFLREQVLPLRISLARTYEDLIAALVNCAKSPGECGTIASIESGSRNRVVLAHDAELAKALGEPLPPEASIREQFRGASRIFVSSIPSHIKAGEPFEIRAFVLSKSKPAEVALFWRQLGKGKFHKVPAQLKARQAYQVSIPAARDGTVEYYLDAVCENGEKLSWPVTAPAICHTSILTKP